MSAARGVYAWRDVGPGAPKASLTGSKDDGDTTAARVDLRSSQTNIWSSTLVDGAGIWTANTRVSDNTSAQKVDAGTALRFD